MPVQAMPWRDSLEDEAPHIFPNTWTVALSEWCPCVCCVLVVCGVVWFDVMCMVPLCAVTVCVLVCVITVCVAM